ncbi:MAG: 50S ribosomal protein L24 [Gammaproteobacteria bacterium]|nr:50S ribosomal protein L24 [Gammaproteobacteria bacterium]
MRKIKKGDTVIVTTGKDKGKTGKVLTVFPRLQKALVEGIKMVKRATKPNPRANKPGGIIEKESKINLSNVAIYNPIKQKADKVKFKILGDGKKVRHFKSNDELIDI